MKKHIILLVSLLLTIFFYSLLNSFVNAYSHSYPYLITRGVDLYNSRNIQPMTIDEYWLLHKINHATGNVPPGYLLYLKEKHQNNPFKRLVDRKNYLTNISIERNFDHLGTYHFYTIPDMPNSIITWDKVFIKALYCDKKDYDEIDFQTLSALKNKYRYHETHYLLGLIFLSENLCYKRPILEKEISESAKRIINEQDEDPEFSDLYAERIVVLYWAGFGDAVKKEWIEKVADSFSKEYGWRFDKNSNYFSAHATGLSLLSLIYYKDGDIKQSIY